MARARERSAAPLWGGPCLSILGDAKSLPNGQPRAKPVDADPCPNGVRCKKPSGSSLCRSFPMLPARIAAPVSSPPTCACCNAPAGASRPPRAVSCRLDHVCHLITGRGPVHLVPSPGLCAVDGGVYYYAMAGGGVDDDRQREPPAVQHGPRSSFRRGAARPRARRSRARCSFAPLGLPFLLWQRGR